mgnify:CR=1 FL=1
MNLSKLQATLPKLTTISYNKTTGDFEEVLVSPHSFIRGDGLHVSLEEGDGAGDYYESMHTQTEYYYEQDNTRKPEPTTCTLWGGY